MPRSYLVVDVIFVKNPATELCHYSVVLVLFFQFRLCLVIQKLHFDTLLSEITAVSDLNNLQFFRA